MRLRAPTSDMERLEMTQDDTSSSRITEELCGHEFSAPTISRVTAKLDEKLERFARRPLEEEYPYLVVDALRADPARRRDQQPGGAGGDRHQLGGPSVRAGRGTGEPGKRQQWERLSAGAATQATLRERVRNRASRDGCRFRTRCPYAIAERADGSYSEDVVLLLRRAR